MRQRCYLMQSETSIPPEELQPSLGRREEAIAVYDDLLARFGSATEPALRERVTWAKSAGDRLRNS
jgi:hypothetical protein